jgi:hypothetical protein
VSNLTFLAWSLLVGGPLAVLFIATANRSRSIEGQLQKLVMVLASLWFGAILTSEFVRLFTTLTRPAWVSVLHEGWILVLGLTFLTFRGAGDRGMTTRQLLGVIMVLMWIAVMSIDVFHGSGTA